MKAIRIHQTGGPEVLQYQEAPLPEPAPGEARVRHEAIGVNFIDIYLRKGLYKAPLPAIPGQEAAGVVDALGAGVSEVRIGARVAYASGANSYAEYATIAASKLVPVPDGISTQQAAATLAQGLTAHYLAFSTYPLKPGETALVHAAAGGVGALLTQVAKMRGARVIATVGNADKVRRARAAGADEVVVYTQEDFGAEVKRLTAGQGVEVVYDSVGKDTFEQSLNCLKRRGMMVLYGQSSGPVPPFDPQILNAKGSLFLTRPTLAHYAGDRVELLWRANDLFKWMAEGKLVVRIDKTFPLSEAADAQIYLASRASMGKLLLVP